MVLKLDSAVQFLKGVGPRRAEAFARIGVRTVEDLLYHVPHRYLDATTVTPIARADVGSDVTLVGRVLSTAVVPTRRRLRIFRAVLKDASGVIECAWPGQAFLDRVIKQGQLLLVTGPIKYYHGRQVVPREHVILGEEGEEGEVGEEGMVLPVYPATEGLSHRQIRRLIGDHLDEMVSCVEDSLPGDLRRATGTPALKNAFLSLHRPAVPGEWETGRRRLALDELFDLQLVVARARHLAKGAQKGPRFEIKKELTTALKGALPFELTPGQKRAIREITVDMVSEARMHRLLMGEVGTGKTVVALFAMLLAVENDYQAAFMAPTELLTEQHGQTLTSLLAPLDIRPEILLGKLSASEKAAIRERIAAGGSRVIVGTHALIQEATDFRRLGLVVIDEQHRFGVEQRAALIEKGEAPDVLLLSATPIPRTLALTFYGDLDMSVLREKPAGRGAVKTGVRSGNDRRKIYRFLEQTCAAGRQAYVVYPVIAESERMDLKAATTMAEELERQLRPRTVGLVHGRMKPDERDAVMRQFRDGELQVLVATTVIEVGIDVPNATVMVIEHAERFGLAQLHQLRGRVGRGAAESHCVLLTDEASARERLKRFARISDGFRIAELDLKERGMGELAGTRQAGGFNLRYADLAQDEDLVVAARRTALGLIARDSTLSAPEHATLRRRIERRYERGMELFRVG
ncbi:MAG: ATP-dependent DNA helicase RecG [Gemmatimonadales bacterium]|nr:ATP-dependent DNA helicase RecG [Gemmatimonadales bacterium]NIN50019.1 ATP-dependent DNA helicase RecG [Gemmatimonadales bacterium]NIP07483.1 ATP-dependent DNA helicase RecG [Gemmatimonadales bacterium]NIR03122.1 ATP-dependent DNA helicase RecG [Gemmatimonadales bacterium]NIS66834.1 ATP-dependent DNA helicase RecG [Gemmatimonadales bacterium]